jgi:hypothetical protein
VSKLENGWNGLRLISARATAAFRKPRSNEALLHRITYFFEDAGQRLLFIESRAQRMKRVYPGDRERCGLDIRARKGFHVIAVRCAAQQRAIGCHVDQHGRDLE